MKHKATSTPSLHTPPSDDDIRSYAYHLFQQGGSEPGHDVDNWVEATACLKANIPVHQSSTRLHRHVNGPKSEEPYAVSSEAINMSS